MASSLDRLNFKRQLPRELHYFPLNEQQSVLRKPERSPVPWVRGRGVVLMPEGGAVRLLVRRHGTAHLVREDGANHDVVKLDLP